MAVYLTGDTHGEVLKRISKKQCRKYSQPILKSGDILIVLGDFGLVWDNKSWSTIKYVNKYLSERGIKIMSVLGNHESYFLIEQLPTVSIYGGKCYEVSSNIHFMQNGELFDIHGYKFAVFGGAYSVDKMYRKEGKSWWSQEIPNKETMQYFIDNLEKINTSEYILLTHTTNYEMVKFLLWNDSPKLDDVSRFLEFVKYHYNFKHHYFGHFHDNRYYNDYTLLYEDIVELKY